MVRNSFPTELGFLAVPQAVNTSGSAAADPGFTTAVARYRQSLHRQLEAIKVAEEQGDAERIHCLTDWLKETAVNYRFPQISAWAGVCQHRLVEGASLDEMQQSLQQLKDAIITAVSCVGQAVRPIPRCSAPGARWPRSADSFRAAVRS